MFAMSGSGAALGELIDAGLVRRGEVVRAGRSVAAATGNFFGIPALDRTAPEGMARSLHMIETADATGDAAAAGFVVSILINLCSNHSPAVWIVQDLAAGEDGQLHGPGLCDMAIDPGALILVRARTPRDVLWAMEEALRSAAVSAVVGEMRNAGRQLDLTATRRLALASERGEVPAYIITSGPDREGATAARTRWRVSSAPGHASEAPGLLGLPAWKLELKKNSRGARGSFTTGFDPATARLVGLERNERPALQAPPRPAGRTAGVLPFPRPRERSGRVSR